MVFDLLVGALVDFSPNLVGMIARHFGCRVNEDGAAASFLVATLQPAPSVTGGFRPPPAKAFGEPHGRFNVFIGVSWSRHAFYFRLAVDKCQQETRKC